MTRKTEEQYTKRVDFVTKNDDQQIASGIVIVPDKVDLQQDFAREETIRQFADQFGNFADVGEADGGVMHAAWPSGWMSLERNEVLDEATEIGDTEAPAGAWIQEWQFNDADLWGLVDDGVLEGYSIGAVNVDWNGPFEQDDVDDVAIPDAIGEDELVWELTDGLIREVSAVDIPAVPDAQILDTKADVDKRLSDHLGNRDGFISEAMERGHTEAEAERLWDVLSRAADVEGAGEPGKQSIFAKAGRAFLSALSGSGSDDGSDAAASPEALDSTTDKEGRTLSRQNRESLYATIDASLDVLEDAGVDHGMSRFTDRDDTSFDLSEHTAREWSTPDDEDDESDEDDETEASSKDATGGETPDDTTDMSDDNPDDEGADKSLAEQNAEQIDELTAAIDDLTDAVADKNNEGGEEKTAEIEIDGEVYEVSKSEALAWFDDNDDGGDDPMADAPEYVRALADQVEAVNERIDTISKQSGRSHQLEAAGEEEDDESGLGGLGKALS